MSTLLLTNIYARCAFLARVLSLALMLSLAGRTDALPAALTPELDLLFVRLPSDGGSGRISRLESSTAFESTVLTLPTLDERSDPTWSPDKVRVLYSAEGAGGAPVIYLVRSDGNSAPIPVTSLELSSPQIGDFNPTWSPTGLEFAFIRKDSEDQSRLMRFRGGLANPGTGEALTTLATWPDIDSLDWSEAGADTFIVFSAFNTGTNSYDLYYLSPENFGAGATAITESPNFDEFNPSWSPDGREVVYVETDLENNERIIRWNRDSGVTTPLLNVSGVGANGLSWSPDGDNLAFITLNSTTGKRRIWVTDANGNNLVPAIEPTDDELFDPEWEPGAARLVFRVLDAETEAPVRDPSIRVQWEDAALGFEAKFVGRDDGGNPLYSTGEAKATRYEVIAFAQGYLPSDPLTFFATADGDVVRTIFLARDSNLAAAGRLVLRFPVLDAQGSPTGGFLLPNTISVSAGTAPVAHTLVYRNGAVMLLGLPSAILTINVDSSDFDIPETIVPLGVAQTKAIAIEVNHVVNRAGGDIPGIIAGVVADITPDPSEPLDNAQIIADNLDTGFAVYATSGPDGSYILPDVPTGSIALQAFSSDGGSSSTVTSIELSAAEVLPNENLEIFVVSNDSDGDGLDDVWEEDFGLDPNDSTGDNGADGDPDGEGLTNLSEYLLDSNPMTQDTDMDAFLDGVESALESDPADNLSVPQALSEVWIDFGYDDPVQAGLSNKPFAVVGDAVNAVVDGGTVLIKGDVGVTTTPETPAMISRPMTLEAVNGTVSIGATP